MRLQYTRPHRINRLGDELAAAFPQWRESGTDGFYRALATIRSSGDTIILDVPDDTVVSAVDNIINTHDPNVLGIAEAQEIDDNNNLSDLANTYQQLKAGLENIRTREAQIVNGPASPTAAQTGTALKLIANDIITMTNGLDKLLNVLRIFVRR
jgi:hypothetical protein